MSGMYIPPNNSNITPNPSLMTYSSRSPSYAGPQSPEIPVQNNVPNGSVQLQMMGMIGSGQYSNTATWAPQQPMPNPQDMPMLDIDWSEWDKLFPLEVNNGDLDLPINASVV